MFLQTVHTKQGLKRKVGKHTTFQLASKLEGKQQATQLKRTRQSRSFFLQSLTTSLSFAVTARPRREKGIPSVTAGLLVAANQPPALMQFLAQQVQGNVAAQCHPRKFPTFQEERNLFTQLVLPGLPRCCVRIAAMKKCLRFLSTTHTSPSQSGLLGQPYLHPSPKFRRLTTTEPSFVPCCQQVHTNQRTRLDRFCRDKGIWQHFIRSHHRLLHCKEEKELAVRPTLPWNVPMRGCCAQAHAVPRVQVRPDASQNGPSHIFCKMPYPPNRSPLQFAWLVPITLSQRSNLKRIYWALQSFVQDYDWVLAVLFPQLQSCLFPSQNVYLCELDH